MKKTILPFYISHLIVENIWRGKHEERIVLVDILVSNWMGIFVSYSLDGLSFQIEETATHGASHQN